MLPLKPITLIFPPKVQTSPLFAAPDHNYAVGGQLVNAFAAGAIGAEDDFWLVALPPATDGTHPAGPLICANLLDPFGRRLLTLERNAPTFNPRGCLLESNPDRLVVTAGRRELLRIEVRPVRAAGCRVSYAFALLKDRHGAVCLETRGPDDSPSVVLHGHHGLGLRPDLSIALNHGLEPGELEVVRRLAESG